MKGVARETSASPTLDRLVKGVARETSASPTLDIFLREDPRFDSLDLQTTIVVSEGCLVREFNNTISRDRAR